ncbi:MAG: hypothetical protein LBL52_01200 [Rickettsiales bacterium]|jgi:hypothetical protein|nr:hypothetical protein [Rickettsiales bacterium]
MDKKDKKKIGKTLAAVGKGAALTLIAGGLAAVALELEYWGIYPQEIDWTAFRTVIEGGESLVIVPFTDGSEIGYFASELFSSLMVKGGASIAAGALAFAAVKSKIGGLKSALGSVKGRFKSAEAKRQDAILDYALARRARMEKDEADTLEGVDCPLAIDSVKTTYAIEYAKLDAMVFDKRGQKEILKVIKRSRTKE